MSTLANKGYGLTAWLILAGLATVWGSSFILMKYGLIAMSPLQIACIRMAVAGLCLSPFVIRYAKLVKRRDWIILFFSGLTGNGIPAYLFSQAETVVPSAVAGLLNSLTPVFILLIAMIAYKARFGFWPILGIFVGLGGAVLMLTAGEVNLDLGSHFSYSLLIVLATIFYAVSTNLIKYTLKDYPSLLITTFGLLFMAIPAVPTFFFGTDWQGAFAHPQAGQAFGAIIILGAVGTALSVSLFVRLLHMTDAIFAASVTYLIPVVAVIWGLVYHEALHWQHMVGFAIIISGVYMINRRR